MKCVLRLKDFFLRRGFDKCFNIHFVSFFFLVTYIQLCIRVEFYYVKLQVLFCFHSIFAGSQIWLTLHLELEAVTHHDTLWQQCQMRIQYPVKHERWHISRKPLHFRCFTEFGKRFWVCQTFLLVMCKTLLILFMIINLVTVHAMIVYLRHPN